jgi:hypothetical protein
MLYVLWSKASRIDVKNISYLFFPILKGSMVYVDPLYYRLSCTQGKLCLAFHTYTDTQVHPHQLIHKQSQIMITLVSFYMTNSLSFVLYISTKGGRGSILFGAEVLWLYTVKKFIVFPVPSRDVTNQTLPGQE